MIDRKTMQEQLLARTKQSYDRRENTGANHFDPESGLPFWKASPTKDKPHIIDIVPFIAGPNFPSKTSNVKEGEIAYVLDVWVHKNVGPGKAVVVCPARNYGQRCPICDEVDNLVREGYEYEDIAIVAKRQCTYNVIVMDSKETEAKGLQVWDVPYAYSEREIVARARSARDNGYIPFASVEREFGRSIVFDVGNDKFKKITGHRFETRDYDLPIEVINETYRLDTYLQLLSYEDLCQTLWGASEKPEDAEPALRQKEKDQDKNPSGPARNESRASAPAPAPAASRFTGRPASLPPTPPEQREASPEEECPYGGQFGSDHDKYGECENCELFQNCSEALDRINYEASMAGKKQEPARPNLRPTPKVSTAPETERAASPAAEPAATPAPAGRRFLGRPKSV